MAKVTNSNIDRKLKKERSLNSGTHIQISKSKQFVSKDAPSKPSPGHRKTLSGQTVAKSKKFAPEKSIPIVFPTGYGVTAIMDDILLLDFVNSEIESNRHYTVGSFALPFRVVEELIISLQKMLDEYRENPDK
jgi:hypothetical protein